MTSNAPSQLTAAVPPDGAAGEAADGARGGAQTADSVALPPEWAGHPSAAILRGTLLMAAPNGLSALPNKGLGVLLRAIEQNSEELAEFFSSLIDPFTEDGREGETALMCAARLGRSEIVKMLLRRAPDPVALARWTSPTSQRPAILHAAGSNAETLRAIFPYAPPEENFGFDPQKKSSQSHRPLIVAAFKGSLDCVRELLPHCDVNAVDALGMNAIFAAVSRGHLSPERLPILRLLLDAPGLDFSAMATLREEHCPLLRALELADDEALALLLPRFDPNRRYPRGNTPLMAAVDSSSACQELLLPYCDASVAAVGTRRGHGSFSAFSMALGRRAMGFADAIGARLIHLGLFDRSCMKALALFWCPKTPDPFSKTERAAAFAQTFPRMFAEKEAMLLRATVGEATADLLPASPAGSSVSAANGSSAKNPAAADATSGAVASGVTPSRRL